jgi:hypothetical protein
MKKSSTSVIVATLAMSALAATLAACNSNPPRATACALPEGPDLDRAISAARFDLQTGCEHQFDQYFQRLLTIAEGDPKKENKTAFSEFLVWANDEGLLSKRQARETYTRYFGVKYVSLISDYSVCEQTCPRQDVIMQEMNRELADKEQGLLKVSADRREYYRANRLFQETELVLQATCEACGPIE